MPSMRLICQLTACSVYIELQVSKLHHKQRLMLDSQVKQHHVPLHLEQKAEIIGQLAGVGSCESAGPYILFTELNSMSM